MKMRRMALSAVLAIVLCLLLTLALVRSSAAKAAKELTVATPDLSRLSDGDYTGAYAIPPVSAEVIVSVRAHRIADIVITRHENGLGGAAEELVRTVVEAQTPDVDAVSGATVSSKCILKAIENALEQQEGREQ